MSRQVIRYVTASDGVRLAWAEAGSGPLLAKASNWLSHLEYEWESPVFRHWMQFFADHFHFIRYDERGCGLTDWNVKNVGMDCWLEDLELALAATRRTARERAIENEARYALRMLGRIRDCCRTAAGDSHEDHRRMGAGGRRVDHELEIFQPAVHADVLDVPVR